MNWLSNCSTNYSSLKNFLQSHLDYSMIWIMFAIFFTRIIEMIVLIVSKNISTSFVDECIICAMTKKLLEYKLYLRISYVMKSVGQRAYLVTLTGLLWRLGESMLQSISSLLFGQSIMLLHLCSFEKQLLFEFMSTSSQLNAFSLHPATY